MLLRIFCLLLVSTAYAAPVITDKGKGVDYDLEDLTLVTVRFSGSIYGGEPPPLDIQQRIAVALFDNDHPNMIKSIAWLNEYQSNDTEFVWCLQKDGVPFSHGRYNERAEIPADITLTGRPLIDFHRAMSIRKSDALATERGDKDLKCMDVLGPSTIHRHNYPPSSDRLDSPSEYSSIYPDRHNPPASNPSIHSSSDRPDSLPIDRPDSLPIDRPDSPFSDRPKPPSTRPSIDRPDSPFSDRPKPPSSKTSIHSSSNAPSSNPSIHPPSIHSSSNPSIHSSISLFSNAPSIHPPSIHSSIHSSSNPPSSNPSIHSSSNPSIHSFGNPFIDPLSLNPPHEDEEAAERLRKARLGKQREESDGATGSEQMQAVPPKKDGRGTWCGSPFCGPGCCSQQR